MEKTAKERQLAGLTSTTYTPEQMKALGRHMQAKGLETRKKNKEQQQSLSELYQSIAKSKVVKKLTPDNVLEYAQEHDIKLDNRTAMSIVQVLKAIQGDTDSYKLILQITGESPDSIKQSNQLSTIDAQRFLAEVSQILRKWITDKELLHNIVVDIMHIRTN